ncbi:MAG: hypothetical protein OXU51_00850 [Candidatus Poribacteria bacterium]|nr:hypothetical protein [Candidatus Poribacteria bacterium]
MFLKSIHLKNVKCFSDVALSFEDENGGIRKWTLLLAENGMGKSTLWNLCQWGRARPNSLDILWQDVLL